MTMKEKVCTVEAPRSADEINRGVRQIRGIKDGVAYSAGISPTMTTVYRDPRRWRPQWRPVQSRPVAGAFTGAADELQLVTPRGRQMTPKPWLMSVLCRLGMHRGQWAYVAEGNCAQGRECGRCGAIHACTNHQPEWRYIRESSCGQVKTCIRCNATKEERTSHAWGKTWEPEQQWWQAKRAHRCSRCGTVEEWEESGD